MQAATTTRGLETAAVVLSWFVLNIAMGSSTKWIYLYGKVCDYGPVVAEPVVAAAVLVQGTPTTTSSSAEKCESFTFPLTITVIHMIFSWTMCHVQIYYIRGKPKGSGLTIGQQFQKVAPLSFFFALSVSMGNLSLKYIYPSFNQMLGAMSPLITVLLAVVLQRKRYNAWTWLSMPVICGGLAVCSMKEMNFNMLGATFATGATILRAVKSLIQGKLLSNTEKMDSVTLLYYMAPWAAAMLSLMAVVTEGAEPLLLLAKGFQPNAIGGSNVAALLMISGLNACFLNVSNFLVTSYTSAVTLQVLGNVKSCLSIAVSVAIFRNAINWKQAVGVVTCLFGVWLYNKKGGAAERPREPASPSQERVSEAKWIPDGERATEMMQRGSPELDKATSRV
mmetsp:Transcript_29748/g.75728  ORF Transcript_29748/g.75728 Transcript_29748/m.75728 type:complete len:393 (+) Transcript_29748:217-1395(+)